MKRIHVIVNTDDTEKLEKLLEDNDITVVELYEMHRLSSTIPLQVAFLIGVLGIVLMVIGRLISTGGIVLMIMGAVVVFFAIFSQLLALRERNYKE